MASTRRPTQVHVDRDGVKIERSGVRPGVWIAVVALGLIGAFLLVRPGGQRSADERPPAPPPAKLAAKPPGPQAVVQPPRVQPQPAAPAHAAAPVEAPRAPVRLVPKPPPEPVAPPVEPEAAAEAPASAPPSEQQSASTDMGDDQPSGIALFPPPGTKPILQGFVVPDDFEVPEGYVKHYQTTDHGQQLAPILMFHPDYQLMDEQGQPIPMPKDRVVPPELLPPGMSSQKLDIPEPPPEPGPDTAPRGRSANPQDPLP